MRTLLGLAFRVLVLVPAMIAALMVLCSLIPYFATGTWLIVSIAVITALQVGYLGGGAIVTWPHRSFFSAVPIATVT
jgi:hypothetical protein